jgi:hypothetical protein
MATIDTHTIIKELIVSGVKEREAETLVSNFVSKSEFLELERDRSGLATKNDINLLQKDIELAKNEFNTSLVKIDIELKWLKAAMIGIFGLLIKIAFFS